MLIFHNLNMSQGTFQMRLWQEKLNKSMTLPVLSGYWLNKISTQMCQGL